MLPWNWSIRKLKIYFASSGFLVDVSSFLISSNEKYSVVYVFLPSTASENSITQFREIAHVHWCRSILVLFFNLLFSFLIFFTNNLLLSFDKFQHLPSYFLSIFVKTFKIRPYISNNFSCFIFFNESYDCKDIKNLRNEIFQIQIFLLIHERLYNLFNAGLGHHIFLINEREKYSC